MTPSRTDSAPRHSPWTWLMLGAGLAAAAVLAASLLPSERWRQIASGVAALGLVLANATYGARKWLLVTRLGSLHAWMAGHVGLGAALLVTVLWHANLSDLGAPGFVLIALVGIQLASGIWAFVETTGTPRRFGPVTAEDVCFPTTARRRMALLRGRVDELLDSRGAQLRDWFERYRPVLEGRSTDPPPLEGAPASDARVAADLHARVAEMARLHAALARLGPAERAAVRWSWIHVPASLALLTMTLLHVIGWIVYG